jgi:hypothetical protein
VAFQFHLRTTIKPEVLDKILPGLGRGWAKPLGGTTSNIFYTMLNYASQWEAVAARWAEDDHTQLQPTEPCWIWPVIILMVMMLQSTQAKELELCAPPLLLYAAQPLAQSSFCARPRACLFF